MESKIYNPAGQPKDWLIDHFVVRTKVFEKLFKEILTGSMQYPEQHYLVQGQRGMGKTTLLLRLKYEIENTQKLNKWLVPVFFNEESYDLTSLSNLWEKLLKYLDSIWETGGEYYRRTDEFIGRADYEKSCYELLMSILNDNEKKLIIFFDNFGQLFLDNLTEKEQHRFREILMNGNHIRIIGASAVVLHDLHDYSKPFFDFFRIVTLDGLNKNETVELITKLQERSEKKLNIEKNKAKIETLAILSGGVIRTIMLIYEVILADEDGTALRDLELILDRITPLYKHRIEDLPVQQRKIIDVIAKKWDATSTKEIAENIRENGKPMPTKLISAQLQQLEKNNVIEKKQTNTKNHLYQLKERFFNIWYLMRHGDRMDKCRVMWLTKFLETWYDDEVSIGGFIQRHIQLLQSGKYVPSSAIMIAEALTYSSKINFVDQAMLIEETAAILNAEDRKLLPQTSLSKLKSAISLFGEKKYEEVVKILESIEQKTAEINGFLAAGYLNISEPQKAINILAIHKKTIPYPLGAAYLQIKDYPNAVKYLKSALTTQIDDTQKGFIANAIGSVYTRDIKSQKEAIKYYQIALEYGNVDAFKNLSDLYAENLDFINAEKYLIQAIEAGKHEFKKDLIESYIYKTKQYEKASLLISENNSTLADEDGDNLFYQAVILYVTDVDKNFEHSFLKAQKQLIKELKTESNNYRLSVSILLDYYIEERNKASALKLVNNVDIPLDFTDAIMKATVHAWENKFVESFSLVNQILDDTMTAMESQSIKKSFELLILLLIAKKQLHFAYNLFNRENLLLKDIFKPIYYALMYHLKDEYPNEYLKMGEELKQPVQDVLARIEQIAIDYV